MYDTNGNPSTPRDVAPRVEPTKLALTPVHVDSGHHEHRLPPVTVEQFWAGAPQVTYYVCGG